MGESGFIHVSPKRVSLVTYAQNSQLPSCIKKITAYKRRETIHACFLRSKFEARSSRLQADTNRATPYTLHKTRPCRTLRSKHKAGSP